MKIEAETVEEYWANVPDDWRRERMLAIREMILELAPDAQETLGWGMLRYALDQTEDRIICHLNAQSRYVGLYLGDVAHLDPEGEITEGMDVGKGCVRVRKGEEIEKIRELVERKVAARRSDPR